MEKAILKVYPSKYWYDNVVIIGNKEGLTKIKEAIESALAGKQACATVEETDGCKYNICSKMHDGDLLDEEWLNLPLHYNDEDGITNEEQEFLSKFLSSPEKDATKT